MELVSDIPEGAPIINIEGKKGESLFRRPVKWFVEKDIELIRERFKRYKKFIETAKEERLLALIGALSMEEALDLFLGAYIPDYSRIESERDFTLYLKIKLAYSLKLIPPRILDAAALINSVRNKFSHELEINSFDSLDNGTQENLKQKEEAFLPNDKRTDRAVKGTFIAVVECVILGLGVYASHVRSAKEYIYGGDFADELVKRIKEEK
jgi:hypothetical protein